MHRDKCSAPLPYHAFLPAQDFASVTRRVSDEERSVQTGTRVSEERAATQSMAQKTSRSKAEVCETPIPQFKSGCRLHRKTESNRALFFGTLNYRVGERKSSLNYRVGTKSKKMSTKG